VFEKSTEGETEVITETPRKTRPLEALKTFVEAVSEEAPEFSGEKEEAGARAGSGGGRPPGPTPPSSPRLSPLHPLMPVEESRLHVGPGDAPHVLRKEAKEEANHDPECAGLP
jgi:hypothetical protein